jgi:hypothetical protein
LLIVKHDLSEKTQSVADNHLCFLDRYAVFGGDLFVRMGTVISITRQQNIAAFIIE